MIDGELPDEVSTTVLGLLSQSPLTDSAVTLYVCPHGRSSMVQEVSVELQYSLAPVLLTAATWKYSASGFGIQEMVMEPSAHSVLMSTFWGGQGAVRGGFRELAY